VDSNGQVYNVQTHELSSAWNSQHLKELRLAFIRGEQPDVCTTCWVSELGSDNSTSVRRAAIERIKELEDISDRIEFAKENNGLLNQSPFDYQTMSGNLCNLACKMCGPRYSTQFSKFFQSQGYDSVRKIKFHRNSHEYNNDVFEEAHDWPVKRSFSQVFKEYQKDIRHIFLTGGEPTIIPENIEFLQELTDSGLSKNISIQLSTNCTNVNKKLLESLENFKRVFINCSIDGMDEIAYIQRTPSNWKQIEKNFSILYNWYRENTSDRFCNVHSTMTSLNAHHLHKFCLAMFDRFPYTNFSVIPIIDKNFNFGLETLPKNVMSKILSEIQQVEHEHHHITNIMETLESIISNVKFADNHEYIHSVLGNVQKLHPELDIKKIYSIYYETVL
jgi:organic radical activating enzyme